MRNIFSFTSFAILRKWKVSAIYLRLKAPSSPNNAWCNQQHSKPSVRCVFVFVEEKKTFLIPKVFVPLSLITMPDQKWADIKVLTKIFDSRPTLGVFVTVY